ncbi:hypothetical protein BAY59_38550 (plasmid) [Prauserella coralliicola]|nr:hypothetical protein BAY59_38550 [Prauserella coralliicola]
MPVEITERYFDPDDPDDYLAQLAHGRAPDEEPESPWVEPDYASIPGDADIPMDEAERTLVWPGPAMIMPAGLLPDGKPPGRSDFDNGERIGGPGQRPRNNAEADAVWSAYMRQQRALRKRAGLPEPVRRPPRWKLEDTPETIEAIKQLHREERARRRHRWAS